MGSTIKPTGLTIERNGDLNFISSWKVGDVDYAKGQKFWYRTNNDEWVERTITTYDTEHAVSLSKSDWYPNTDKKLSSFQICLQGTRSDELDESPSDKKAYDWKETNGTNYGAEWETYGYESQYSRVRTTFAPSKYSYKTKYIYGPNKPSLSAALDSERNNVTTFSWTIVDDENNNQPFTKTEYQSMMVEDISDENSSSPWKLKWEDTSTNYWYSGSRYNESESIEIVDDIRTSWSDVNEWRSRTRIFRTRALGPGGESSWSYAKHVYAKPYRPSISKVTWANDADALSMSVYVEWTAPANAAHPIDSVEVQYLIATPLAGQTCPSGASWQVAATVADTAGTDAEKITIDTRPGADQCLWIQIVAKHDDLETATSPYLVRSGSLTAPEQIDSLQIFEGDCSAEIGVTNASTVEDSKIAIVFWREQSDKSSDEYVCGIIERPDSSYYENPILVSVNFNPGDTLWFGAYAFQGSYSSSRRSDGKTQYTVKANMKSSTTWYGGAVPPAPSLRVTSERLGEAHVDWTWNWLQGIQAEISWSKDQYAWNSIEGPQTYIVDNMHWSDIRIPNLETGVRWYFRARLGKDYDGSVVYGPYSDTVSIDMATIPAKPILTASKTVVIPNEVFNLSWTYENEDGSPQSYAAIYLCRIDNDDSVSNIRQVTFGMQEKTVAFWPEKAGAQPGESFYLRVSVRGYEGFTSEYSDPIKIDMSYRPRCRFESISMSRPSSEQAALKNLLRLRSMPLNVCVEGMAEGTTAIFIKRAESYQLDRPDESVFNGFEGETVLSVAKVNSDELISDQYGGGGLFFFTITNDMLTGALDDGAKYTITAISQDKFGQVATASEEFIVEWDHQAIIPQATASVDKLTAFITPTAPTGAGNGDSVDIYRLSADKPELIVRNGSFGTTYVDPYPASGIFGGHRVVYKTANGDYITADNQHAWIDLGFDDGDYLEFKDIIIDFGGDRVQVRYNLDLDNSWEKEFEETKYLGGSVQGDWNPGVSRNATVGGVILTPDDNFTIQMLRRLAVYAGVCHVRTPEGSSFAADVQVSESRKPGRIVAFTLSITRVDAEGLDGMTYDEWVGGTTDELV